MIRARIGLFIVMLLGAIYAAAGLLTSLREFGIGLTVVGLAACGQGLVTYLHDHQIVETRRQVWLRRDS